MIDDLYQRQRRQLTATTMFNWPGLQGWSFYFIGKALLAWFGSLNLLGLWNAAFIAALVVPLPYQWLRVLRQLLALPLAAALLYRESHLPPISRLLAQWEQVSQFSWNYLLELTTRLVSFELLALIMVAWIVYLYVRRVLRMTVVAVVLLSISVWWQQPAPGIQPLLPAATSTQPLAPLGVSAPTPDSANPDTMLAEFYRTQSRVLERPEAAVLADTGLDIDIVMINICSMSWQDLETYNLANHPFLRRQDIIFNQYTSGSSYSGPAALRLLRANCGHVPHEQLFSAANNQCYLTESLAELGYSSQLVLNHTGEFDNFKSLLAEHGGFAGLPVRVADSAPQIMTGFDDTPIYDDLSILQNLLEENVRSATEPRFSFYNTVTLHDGNRLIAGENGLPANANNSARNYPQRLEKLLNDLNTFYDDVKASGRPTLIVIAPEHGSGLQGDAMQLPGVREIPTPALTQVPIMMRLIAPELQRLGSTPVLVSEPVGTTAISASIYEILGQRPVRNKQLDVAAVVQGLPQQPYVAENDSVTVMERELQLWLKIEEQDWIVYPTTR